jgi:four helix bundle protein
MDEVRRKTRCFEDLIVWQKAHSFALGIYKLTKTFPSSELYGLTSQFRRSAVSIAANIAEGYKKRGTKDKIRFLNIAQGSLEESRYYLILARDLNYATDQNLDLLVQEISKLLEAYINKMKQNG